MRVASALPELAPDRTLFSLVHDRALALTALVQLLRDASGDLAPEPPPLRAAILFDDPNLRWRTYGFVDFARLLDHADSHGYHASMAMVPLDGRGQHRGTVALFRSRPDRLSLALHGNNHVAQELMRARGEPEALSLAAQAMRRATRFEARYGLGIDRVMVPPHGLCSPGVVRALGALGYDALCAIHPLPWSEQAPADRPLAGWGPAELVDGCAVLPRLPLGVDPAEIALRAFLDQPLILYGHHDDLASGMDLLAETAEQVNRLGDVRWLSLGEIAASNWSSRRAGSLLRIRAHANRLSVPLPEGVDSVLVETPRDPEHGFAGWLDREGPVNFGSTVAAAPGPTELRLVSSQRASLEAVPDPAPRIWPVLRRAATEARDRVRPLVATRRP